MSCWSLAKRKRCREKGVVFVAPGKRVVREEDCRSSSACSKGEGNGSPWCCVSFCKPRTSQCIQRGGSVAGRLGPLTPLTQAHSCALVLPGQCSGSAAQKDSPVHGGRAAQRWPMGLQAALLAFLFLSRTSSPNESLGPMSHLCCLVSSEQALMIIVLGQERKRITL